MTRFISICLPIWLACGCFATTADAQNPLKLIEAFQQKQKQANQQTAQSADDESIPELRLPAPGVADAPQPVDDPFDIDEPLRNVESPENEQGVEELETPSPAESKDSQNKRPASSRQDERQIPKSLPAAATQAFLGAAIEKAAGGQLGVKVKDVLADSPAEAAGIQAGDRLISVAGSPITSEQDLRELLKVLAPGDRIEVEFVRGLRKSKTVATVAAAVANSVSEIELSSAQSGQPESRASHADSGPYEVIPVPADDRFDPRAGNQNSPPKLGLQVIDVVEETGIGLRKRVRSGAGVQSIAADSPAAQSGLPIGALIVGANGRRVEKAGDLVGYIATLKPGQEVELTYYDGNRLRRSKIQLTGDGVRPAADFQPLPDDRPSTDNAVRPILKGLGQQLPAFRRVDDLLERIAPKSAGKVDGAAADQAAPTEGLGALREKLRIQQERNRPLAERLEKRPSLFPRGR